ncbi:MAG: acyl-CoA dehydrogenase family protein, partial [Anaerolineales bacterium]
MDFELTQEQQMWREAVHDFAEKEVKSRAKETDEKAQFNWEAVKKMGPLGLLGLNVPEEYGGAGVDAVSAAIAIEELGWACGSTALAVAAHNGLACAPIALFGSDELKARWLPHLASGKGKLGALALTEPGAGSDLQGGVKTKAVVEGDSWIIDGQKMWTTNASIADVIVTLCRTED